MTPDVRWRVLRRWLKREQELWKPEPRDPIQFGRRREVNDTLAEMSRLSRQPKNPPAPLDEATERERFRARLSGSFDTTPHTSRALYWADHETAMAWQGWLAAKRDERERTR
jgi:hypothetical protein